MVKKKTIASIIKRGLRQMIHNGMVSLIGAGPGDIELITLKAQRLIRSADVVLYDYLVHPSIVFMAEHAIKICVGKKKGGHSTKQRDINELMVRYAKQGRSVARLKGGDPMIFGRCGEEMTYLNDHNIPFQVVPGVSSAVAAPIYAGIPLTHRDMSRSVAFITATQIADEPNMNIPQADTVVIMMGLLRLGQLVQRLKLLYASHTPIAIIESGTIASETIISGTLDTIESLQQAHQLGTPALLVVGDVVGLRDEFQWRAALPLHGQRVVISRPRHQQSKLMDGLVRLGADVLSLSLNHITPIDDALHSVDMTTVTHVILTSENGVTAFVQALLARGLDCRALSGKTIVAIGPATTNALAKVGLTADDLPTVTTSEGIVDALCPTLTAEHHVLIPTSSEADDALPTALGETSATVNPLVVFNNDCPPDAADQVALILPTDHLVFMNAASVRRMAEHYDLSQHTGPLISIGPKTTAEIAQHSNHSVIEANTPTVADVIACVCL